MEEDSEIAGRPEGNDSARKGRNVNAEGIWLPGQVLGGEAGNVSVRDFLPDERCAEAVLRFVKATKVGTINAGAVDRTGCM